MREREAEQRGKRERGRVRGRVYGVSFTRWPSPFIANLLNETCRAYIVRLLVPSVSPSTVPLLSRPNLSTLETLYRLRRHRGYNPIRYYKRILPLSVRRERSFASSQRRRSKERERETRCAFHSLATNRNGRNYPPASIVSIR